MNKSYQKVWLYVLFFVMLLLLRPQAGYDGDVNFWTSWAIYIKEHGFPNLYQNENNNYNPLFHYILWLFGWIVGSVGKIEHYRHQIKCITLLFDFGGALLVSSLVIERERRFMVSLLLLFNIAYLYDTLIWEQVDAIYAFFALAAAVAAIRGRTVGSVLLYVLAFNAKTQAIIFLPPLLLLWGSVWVSGGWRKLPVALLAGAALQVAILSPFIWFSEQNAWPRIVEINRYAADIFPCLSMNAYNLWVLMFREQALLMLEGIHDTVEFHGLTYRQWGMLMFATASAVALWPMLLLAVRNVLARRWLATVEEQALVLLSCGLLPLLFTYLNTQMHERYWHPALLFVAAHAFLMRRCWLYILFSFAYFLQLEVLLQSLKMKNYAILFFNPYFIAGLFTICILGGFFELYRLVRMTQLLPDIRQLLAGRRHRVTHEVLIK
jgi:hypothetical protein